MAIAKRFVSWAAVSSLPQAKKISLHDQQKICRQHVERHGGQLVAELVVPGESRSIVLFEDAARKMDAYAKLKQLIDERAFDVFIYLDTSRLGRKAPLSMAVVALCHEAGIVTYETDSPPASLSVVRDGYDDMLIGAIRSVGAQKEVDKTSARHESGMKHRAERGEFAGNVPWGWTLRYTPDGERVVEVDPIAAVIIREVFLTMYLERGWGRRRIVDELNARAIPSPKNMLWITPSIDNMFRLLNRYAGWAEINVASKRPYIKAPGKFPAILTDDEVEAIRKERHVRRSARRSVSTTYRFSLCVWCATCNRRMAMSSGQRTNKVAYQYQYRCRNKHPHSSVHESRVARAVRNAIEKAQDPAFRQAFMSDDSPTIEPILTQIANTQAAIKKLHASLLRMDDEYAAGTIDRERYRRQDERIKAQIASHEMQLNQLRTQMASETHVAKRGLRLTETAKDGFMQLENPDIKAANVWMRHHLEIWLHADGTLEAVYI